MGGDRDLLCYSGDMSNDGSMPPKRRIDSPSRQPRWPIILLSRVQEGEPIAKARYRSGSKVSADTIKRYGGVNPEWYRGLMDAEDAAVTGHPITPRELASGHGLAEEDRRHALAMGQVETTVRAEGEEDKMVTRLVADRDSITAMRLGADVRGDIGHGATVNVANQVNVGQLIMAIDRSIREEEGRSRAVTIRDSHELAP